MSRGYSRYSENCNYSHNSKIPIDFSLKVCKILGMVNSQYFTQKDIINFIKANIAASGLSQKAYAESIEVLPTFLNEVLSGRRNPSGRMLQRFGWQKVTVWIDANGSAPEAGGE